MRCRVILVVLCMTLAAGGCAGPARVSSGKIDVVASFFPIYEAARTIGGNRASVTNLTPAGVEPHDIELTSKDVDKIIDADVVFYFGHGFQPAVEEAARRAKGRAAELLGFASLEPGSEGNLDPHIWLDPHTWATVVARFASTYSLIDADRSAEFESRANAYVTRIKELDREYRTGLTTCARHDIVTTHEAFGYLGRRYKLTQLPITGISPEAEPSPTRLAELIDLVKKKGITTIFTETLVSPKVAHTLAREAGVRTAMLDPLEGLTSDEVAAGADYVSVMRRNLATLRTALGCR